MKSLHKIISIVVFSVSVLAQQAAAQTLEEIVVTAQKRAESVQEVPISITALDEEFLERSGIDDIRGLTDFVPGLNARVDAPTQSVFAIRGIGTNAFSVSADASVGIFVDDIYAGHPLIAGHSFFDVERIEVIKGPQGTLFGRNTSAGAIAIISKKADRDEIYAEGRLGFGSKDQQIYQGIVNYSPGSDWGVRVAAKYEKRDGTFKNTTTGNEINDKDNLIVRVNAARDWTDRFRTSLGVEYVQDNSFYGNTALNTADRQTSAEVDEVTQNARPHQDVDMWRAGLRMEWDLTDNMTFTSITSYLDAREEAIPTDFDLITLRILEFKEPDDFRYFSQELRLNGTTGNFDWFVGASVRDENVKGDTQLRYSDDDVISALVGVPCATLVPAALCDPDVVESSIAEADNFAWGIYADVAWQVTERLRLTFGARYSEDEKDIFLTTALDNSATALVLGDNLLELSTVVPIENTDSWTDFSPRVVVDFDVTGDIMVYGNVAWGYKAGGFNSLPDPARGLLAPGQVQIVPVFEPEENIAYELGFKSTLLDGRARLNAAGYFIDYSDYQVETLSGIVFVIQNVADAENWGAEVDGHFLVTENFELIGSYSYIDSEITQSTFFDPATGAPLDISGNPLPFAPEHSATIIGQYTHPIPAWNAELGLRLEYNYVDDLFISVLADPVVEQLRSRDVVNMRASLESTDGKWSLSVIGENVFDERWFEVTAAILEPLGVPNIGDLWRAELRYTFD